MARIHRMAIVLALLVCACSAALGARVLLKDEKEDRDRRGGGKGDPMMTTFDGRTFEFMGKVGSYYNVMSEKNHQLTMRLKLGQMWDHNGTYMDGIGMRYINHEVVAELSSDDSLHVYLDGKRLHMAADENEQEHIMALASGEMMLLWQRHRPDMGEALEITTDMASVTIFVTPAGSRDEGGVVQPAYLNFDAVLLGPPAGDMTGIIGESYGVLSRGVKPSQAELEDFEFHGEEADFEMGGYFDTEHKLNRFGVAGMTSPKRRLVEHTSVAFPLRASAGPISRRPSA